MAEAGTTLYTDQGGDALTELTYVGQEVRNQSGASINRGEPVYVTGWSDTHHMPTVAKADAGTSGHFPILGCAGERILDQANGQAVATGTVKGIDTSAWAIRAQLFVKPGGGLTTTEPTLPDIALKVAIVTRVSATEGEIFVAAKDTGTGTAGGTVAVHEEGAEVLSATAILNFVGAAIEATDAGGGQVDITVTPGTAPVDSVFGRTGTVTAQASDYAASQIDNDSGVSGAKASDALDTLDVGKLATLANTGMGSGIFAQKNGTTAELKSLVAGTGIQLNPTVDSIEIVNLGTAGEANTGANVGDPAGVGVFDGKTGTTLEFRRLKPNSNKLTAQVSTQTVLLDVVPGNLGLPTSVFGLTGAVDINALPEDVAPAADDWLAKEVNAGGTFEKVQASTLAPAQSVGAGEVLYKGRVGLTHEFKSIVAGTGVTLTPGTDTLQIDATGDGGGEVNTASNLGTGEGVFAQKTGVDLEFKGLKATGGLGISSTADSVTLDGAALGGHPNPGTDTHASDADITELDAGTAKEIQNVTATYTADRTLPLPTSGATTGLFYVVRRNVPLHTDAFVLTVSIGGSPVCHIPAGHVAVVYRDSTTWRTWAGVSPILTRAASIPSGQLGGDVTAAGKAMLTAADADAQLALLSLELLSDIENQTALSTATVTGIDQLLSSGGLRLVGFDNGSGGKILPDAVNEQTVAIQAVIDEVDALGFQRELVFEAGTYRVRNLNPRGLILRGQGRDTVLRYIGPGGVGERVISHDAGGGANRTIQILDSLRLHGQGDADDDLVEDAYWSNTATDTNGAPNFRNLWIGPAGRHAINVLGATNLWIHGFRTDRVAGADLHLQQAPLRRGTPVAITGESTFVRNRVTGVKIGNASETASVTGPSPGPASAVVTISGGDLVAAGVVAGDKFVAQVATPHTVVYEVQSVDSTTQLTLTTTWQGGDDATAPFLITNRGDTLFNNWVNAGFIPAGTVERAAKYFGHGVIEMLQGGSSNGGGYNIFLGPCKIEWGVPGRGFDEGAVPAELGNGVVLDVNTSGQDKPHEITLVGVTGFTDSTVNQLIGFSGTDTRQPNVHAIGCFLDGANRTIRDYRNAVSLGDGVTAPFWWQDSTTFAEGVPSTESHTHTLADVTDSAALAALGVGIGLSSDGTNLNRDPIGAADLAAGNPDTLLGKDGDGNGAVITAGAGITINGGSISASGITSVNHTVLEVNENTTITDAHRKYEVSGSQLIVRRLLLRHSTTLSSTVTVTIDDGVGAGVEFEFLQAADQTGTCTVQRQTNGTIDGGTSVALPASGLSGVLIVDETDGTTPVMRWEGSSTQAQTLYGGLDRNGQTISGAATISGATTHTGTLEMQNALTLGTGASAKTRVQTKATGYTLQASDSGTIIIATAALTITVPSVGTLGEGFYCDIYADGGAVTIDGPGATNLTVDDGNGATIAEANSKQYAFESAAYAVVS